MSFSLVAASGGYSLAVVCWLLTVVSCCGARLLGSMGFSICGVPWHVESSGSGIEPVSSELAGEFFTTEPPGKPGR